MVVINAGSSSIKFSLFAGHSAQTLGSIARGEIEGIWRFGFHDLFYKYIAGE